MSLLSQPFDPAREAALVTGAGNGIGRAIAQALTGEGVRTVFADINRETVTAAVKTAPRPELAFPWVGDLAKPAACDALLADAKAAVGQVTHFVHSASPPRREADHALAVSDETWQQMRAVNVDAGFHLARALARQLIAAKAPGSLLFLTSLHAGTPRNLPHYATSKAALAMLVKELAKTFGRFNIRVNALVPGAIAAGGFVADPALARHIPLGRLGEASDLAPLALAVLSNRVSGYVTGAAIVIDGGLSLTNWFEPPDLGDILVGEGACHKLCAAGPGTRPAVRRFLKQAAADGDTGCLRLPLQSRESEMTSEMQIHTIARQMLERHGIEAIAHAASNALACERRGEPEEASEWRHVEDALKIMRGPHQS